MKRERIDFIIANSAGLIEACQRIADESYANGFYKGSTHKNLIETELAGENCYYKMKKFIYARDSIRS